MLDLLIKNALIVQEGDILSASLAIDGEKITGIFSNTSEINARKTIDAKGCHVLPGCIDPHCHIRYPGGAIRETFETGTRGAIMTGTTTIIEMPVSTPSHYCVAALEPRIDAIEKESFTDVALFGAAGGENIKEIPALAKAGVVAYKTFLHAPPVGREEDYIGMTCLNNYELLKVMQEISKTGLPLSAHGEDNEIISNLISEYRRNNEVQPIFHARSRPPFVELLAVEKLLTLAQETACEVYLVHLSTPEAIEAALRARERGVGVWIETCPHYLYLTEDSLNELGSYAKCNPCLKSKEVVENMWKYVRDGSIDTIGSDHAPYTEQDKKPGTDDIFAAQAGLAGIESRVGLILKSVFDKTISINRAVNLLSTNAAKAYGLYPRKGTIRIGSDADLIICDMTKKWVFQNANTQTMARNVSKAYEGWELGGVIQQTILRGQVVYDEGKVVAKPGCGQLLRRGR